MEAINFLYACTSEIATINKKKTGKSMCEKKTHREMLHAIH